MTTLVLATKAMATNSGPDGDPNVIPFPVTPDRTRYQQRLGGVLNEHQPAA